MLVVTTAVAGVELPSVEFDDQAILLVVAVATAPAAVRLGELDLLAGRREPVGLLHVPVVAVLENRVRTVCRLRDDLVEVGPPAELLARGGLAAQTFLAGQVPREGPGHRRDDVIEAGGRVHQVDDRLLGERMRRDTTREPPVRFEAG
jgi:hypothetical protein